MNSEPLTSLEVAHTAQPKKIADRAENISRMLQAQAGAATLGATQRFHWAGRCRVGCGPAAALKDGASFRDFAFATVIARNPIMADAHQGRRQQAQAEATD